MEFRDVVTRRRMVRSYAPDPLDSGVVDQLVDMARRAPAAGNTQGTHFVVLEGRAQTGRYWNTTLSAGRRASFAWPRLLEAPALLIACADPRAYVERYSEADKLRTGLGAGIDAWSVPYWHVDTAMAVNTLLLAAEDLGLSTLFFGVFDNEDAVKTEFGIPELVRITGVVAIGYGDGNDRPSLSSKRGLANISDIVHRGQW